MDRMRPSRITCSGRALVHQPFVGWNQSRPTCVISSSSTPCDCCGQVVAKRLWVVQVDGEERRFCGPECEQLYSDYVLAGRRG